MSIPYRLTTPDARRAYYAEWFERLERIPGVAAVGGTTRIPLGSTSVTTSVQVQGKDVPISDLPEVEFRRAMHNYFTAMGIPIRRGRGFTAEDGPNSAPTVIVNEAMARRVFGTDDPIGQHIRHWPQPVGPVEHGGRRHRRHPALRTRGAAQSGDVRELHPEPPGRAVHRAADRR